MLTDIQRIVEKVKKIESENEIRAIENAIDACITVQTLKKLEEKRTIN